MMHSSRRPGGSGDLYCEICGFPIAGRPYKAVVEGVEMVLCASCYSKLARSGRAKPLKESERRVARAKPVRIPRRTPEMYEVVEDYPDRIREARIRKGYTLKELAQKLRISESLLRSIEQGRFKPGIDLARRMERLLGVKLLEPVEEDYFEEEDARRDLPTLGDIVVVRRDED